MAEMFRIGPWHCSECNTYHLYLPLPKSPKALEAAAAAKPTRPESRSANKFIRGEESLILKRMRTARFSEKYRDDVIQRILSGRTTIDQVRRELEITQRDILDWISDMMVRRESRIGELEAMLGEEAVRPARRIAQHPVARYEASDVIIDGKVESQQ